MIAGINHVTLMIGDKQEAESFYCGKLGFEKVVREGRLWIRIGEQFIHLSEDVSVLHRNDFQHFAIEVEDLIPFLNKLIDGGVDVFDLNDQMERVDVNTNLNRKQRMYFVRDPFGNLVEFIDKENEFFYTN